MLGTMRTESPLSSDLSAHSLHVADADTLFRFGRMFAHLSLALAHEGVRMTLLTDDPTARDWFAAAPIRVLCTPALSGWRSWRAGIRALRRMERPPRATHVWSARAIRAASPLLRAAPARLVHVSTMQDVARIARDAAPPGAIVTAASERLADLLPGESPEAVILPPAVLTPRRVPFEAARGRALALLWTGRLELNAGLLALLEAAERMRDRGIEYRLALLGIGARPERVYREISRRRLHQLVTLVDDARPWDAVMSGIDVCVVPGAASSVHLAPLLAMGVGKLVIASDDQLAGWFVRGQTYLSVPAASADGLASCVARIVEGLPDAPATARAAADYVARTHTISKLADALLSLEAQAAEEAVRAASPGGSES